MRKMEMLVELYKMLWVSADFETDFQADWLSVYNMMIADDAKKLPEPVIKCCYKYLLEWKENNADLIE